MVEKYGKQLNIQTIFEVHELLVEAIATVDSLLKPKERVRGIPRTIRPNRPAFRLLSEQLEEPIQQIKNLLNVIHVDLDIMYDHDYKLLANPIANISMKIKALDNKRRQYSPEQFELEYEETMTEIIDIWEEDFIPSKAKEVIRREFSRYLSDECETMSDIGFNIYKARKISDMMEKMMFSFGRSKLFTKDEQDDIYDIMEDIEKAIEEEDEEIYHNAVSDLLEISDDVILPSINRRV